MYKSALRPEPFRPGVALPASLGLHGGVFGAILLSQLMRGAPEPLINPDEVMEVSLMAMPKQTTNMVQKATRTADPLEGSPDATEPLPPSDAELALHTPDAPENQGDKSKARDELMEQIRRDQARKDALAALGDADRARTDPDGVEGAEGSATGLVSDPKLAAYVEKVRQAILKNFNPIQTEKLVVIVNVTIDAEGRILEYAVRKTSGNPSCDALALRTVMKTETLPPPPPEYMRGPTETLPIRLSNQDLQ